MHASEVIIQLGYLVAAILFVLSLKWMSHPSTARRSIRAAELAIIISVAGVMLGSDIVHYTWIISALAIGAIIGIPLGWVAMTAVPQRTALSHAFGALCVTIVGGVEYYLDAPNIVPFKKVRELYDNLTKRGIDVKFAVHPVAARMPGHMNVLLAEANIPYDHMIEMDDANSEMPQADVALVIGANDVTNPAARTDPSSPIYGMPVLDVDKARTVMVVKRSMNPGLPASTTRSITSTEP